MALKDNPIKGPFPDGDSRNITLTKGDNPMEPDRTGPQEPTYRDDDAPDGVIGDLDQTELKPGADAPETNNDPDFVQIGTKKLGELATSLTPGSDSTSVMGEMIDKVGDAFGLGENKDNAADSGDQVTTKLDNDPHANDARDEGYKLKEEPEPSASDTAFGVKGGGLPDPVLEKDWNPAERNSDDLSK